MKARLFAVLVVLFASIVLSAPAFAAPIFTIPIDPGIFIPPILTLDPCFGADYKIDMGTVTVYDTTSGTGYYTGVYTYDMTLSGNPLGHVITNYKRATFGGTDEVAMEDTFIDTMHNLTVFGRSVNLDNTGIIGVHGVIIGVINSAGVKNDNIKGTYLTTSFGGPPNRLCFFIDTP